jgi:23S rRNA pseudouridine1911/1915/1917 synthase
VEAGDAGRRLDAWLAGLLPDRSRNQIQDDIKAGRVRVDERERAASHRLRGGERVELDSAQIDAAAGRLLPTPIPLDVVHEDEALLIVNKPAGLVTHPGPGHARDTLANALLARIGRSIADVGGAERCGLVHRLDKLTSGLLLVAKTDAAHGALTAALAERRIDRRYLGLAFGHFDSDEGEIERPIGRRKSDRKLMGVEPEGRPAKTGYRVLLQGRRIALLHLRLFTGRTHQIRVHLQSIGHPILGDREYGHTKKHALGQMDAELRSTLGPVWPARQMLHAAALAFDHPLTGERIEMTSGPPEDMMGLIELVFGKEAFESVVALESKAPDGGGD